MYTKGNQFQKTSIINLHFNNKTYELEIIEQYSNNGAISMPWNDFNNTASDGNQYSYSPGKGGGNGGI